MRITFLLPRYGWRPSGGFSVVYTYASLLVQRGHEVAIVHARRLPPGGWPVPGERVARLRYAAGRVRDRFFRPRAGWASVDSRVRMLYVRDFTARNVPDADVVIGTWWSTVECMRELPASSGVQFHLVQGYETWGGADERVDAVWRAPIHKIFIAQWLMERGAELGVPARLMTVIPNAIDHDTHRITRDIATRERRVAMLYSPQPYKGGDIGVEILQRTRRSISDLTAILFGVGPPPRALPPWIEYVRGASGVRLTEDVYNRSAVYLCPSLSEGWHLPPAEAMACGCALVSSDIGGVRDYAVDGETALLYPAGEIAAAATLLTTLLRDDAARTALAERGAARIRQFSWHTSVALLEDLLAQASRSERRRINAAGTAAGEVSSDP